jgi:hypothetical protein
MLYSLINEDGYIVQSMYTNDSNLVIPMNHRLLPDSPPQPPEIIPGFTRAVRMEPVGANANMVQYEIVQVIRTPRENEVLI